MLGDLQQQARNGSYVLELEKPPIRKMADHAFKELASERAKQNELRYGPLFSALSVEPAVSVRLQQHLSKIDEAAERAFYAAGDLRLAQFKYDEKIRSLLSADNYKAYREYESGSAAREETQKIASFALTQGMVVSESTQDVIRRIVQEAGSYTETPWHGPYDNIPEAATGGPSVIAFTEARSHRIESSLPALRLAAAEAGFSGAYAKLLEDYFAAELSRDRQEIEIMRNPAPTHEGLPADSRPASKQQP